MQMLAFVFYNWLIFGKEINIPLMERAQIHVFEKFTKSRVHWLDFLKSAITKTQYII